MTTPTTAINAQPGDTIRITLHNLPTEWTQWAHFSNALKEAGQIAGIRFDVRSSQFENGRPK